MPSSIDAAPFAFPVGGAELALQRRKWQTYVPIEMSQALGYHGNIATPGGPTPFGPSPKAFGHGGAGGQVGCRDLDNDVTIGFVRSQLS